MTSGYWWIYSFPVLMVAVLMIFLPDMVAREVHENWFKTIYLLCCLLLAGMIFPLNDFLSPYRSALVTKDPIARHVPQGQLLYQYRVNFYGIDFYNKIRTPIVADIGELRDGMIKMPPHERKKYFLTVEDFSDKVKQENEIYCITQHQEKLSQLQSRYAHVDILWNNGAYYLLRITNKTKE